MCFFFDECRLLNGSPCIHLLDGYYTNSQKNKHAISEKNL